MRRLWHRFNALSSQRICIFCRGAEDRWLRWVGTQHTTLRVARTHSAAALVCETATSVSDNNNNTEGGLSGSRLAPDIVEYLKKGTVDLRPPSTNRPVAVRSKLALLSEFHKSLATQDIDRIWPLYSTLYRHNYLHYLTRRNFHQLFVYTARGRANHKNLRRMLALMDDMKVLGTPLRLSEYNMLMNWVGGRSMVRKQSHHLTTALGIFDEMAKHQIQPDLVSYNTLIHIASQVSDMRTAQRLYHDMVAHGIRPDAYTYSTLIHSMGKMGDVPSIERLLIQIRESGVANNTITWNAVMASYAHNGVLDKAESMFGQMCDALAQWRRPARRRRTKGRESTDPHETPVADVESFRTLITMRLRQGRLAEAMDGLGQMVHHDIKPIAAIYNALFAFFMTTDRSPPPEEAEARRTSDLRTVRQLYASMQQTKTTPNSDTMYTLVSALLDLGDTKFALETFVKLSNETLRTDDLNMSSPVATLTRHRFRTTKTIPTRIEPNQILMDRLTNLVSQSSL
ncbi:hypothetical protein DFQ28_001120 [Apophysomyces sp. BC1034]|nr:hypothetical protein DFQ30_001277 [Apophysomyces sp. BC1015]KAG0180520.1 hypothetical protein DFQ29_000519 [Apophysomyces sp. BC1021]KAG0190996.1 hypothetical protein DFQ28_001120 [Apophysomyces sp. BC1034]